MQRYFLENGRRALLAAQYIRMSADHQRYSFSNQMDAIAAYAEEHGLTVVATYADEAKRGITLAGRGALQQLLHDVQRNPSFATVLVYDVSRWGRFQDADESAYYEYLCRAAGVQIEYCAEQFGSASGIAGSLLKAVKRVMAAEYSRELSTKVAQGHRD